MFWATYLQDGIHTANRLHARVPAHRPLEGLFVKLAAVVHEPGVIPLGAGAMMRSQKGHDSAATARGEASATRGPAPHGIEGVELETVVSHGHLMGHPKPASCFSGSRRRVSAATRRDQALVS